MRIYAIGDIHGQLAMLQAAHDLIAQDRATTGDKTAPVIHLGDLCDRGPDSKGVIDLLINGIADGEPWNVIKGNHDRMFSGFLSDPDHHDKRLWTELTWLDDRLGGTQTLASYGVKANHWTSKKKLHQQAEEKVPKSHVDFLTSLPLTFRAEGLFFCHAGVKPGVALEDQDEEDLVWIREPFLSDESDHGAIIVHGHTPVDEASHFGNRIALDTGAGYGRPLTAVVFEGTDCFVLESDGRRPLPPPPR